MAGIGIALKGAGKVLKKFSKKVDRWADKEAGKMIKQMNSPKAIEKAKGYSKLVGGTLAASAAMPSSIEKDQRVRKSKGGKAENPIAVLLSAVVLASKAILPSAVFEAPVLFAARAL